MRTIISEYQPFKWKMYIKVASSQQLSVMGIGRPNSSFIHFTFTEDKEVLSKL